MSYWCHDVHVTFLNGYVSFLSLAIVQLCGGFPVWQWERMLSQVLWHNELYVNWRCLIIRKIRLIYLTCGQVISMCYVDNNWRWVGADGSEQQTVRSCHFSSVHAFQGTRTRCTTSFEAKCWDIADAGIRGLGPKLVPGSVWSIRMLNDRDVCCDDYPGSMMWSAPMLIVSDVCCDESSLYGVVRFKQLVHLESIRVVGVFGSPLFQI